MSADGFIGIGEAGDRKCIMSLSCTVHYIPLRCLSATRGESSTRTYSLVSAIAGVIFVPANQASLPDV